MSEGFKEEKEEGKKKETGQQLESTQRVTLTEKVRAYFLPVTFFIGIIIVIGLLGALVFKADIFSGLSDPSFARGVITFLISVATIGLAFVLVFQSVLGGSGPDSENAFRRSREVFAGLMGVLGTIVGFYFGSAEKAVTPLEIVEVRATEQQVLARVQGGTTPYGYLITYVEYDKPDSKKEIKGVSKDGWIVEDLKPPANPNSKITVDVTDNKQQKTSKVGKVPERMPPVQKPSVGEEKGKPGDTSPAQKLKK